jgi:hypothetical protein
MLLRNNILFMRRNGTMMQVGSSLGYFLFRTTVLFLLRSLREPGGFRRAVRSWRRAVGWNVRDARKRRRWRMVAAGPDVCGGRHPEV